jgi:hypothetical protein
MLKISKPDQNPTLSKAMYAFDCQGLAIIRGAVTQNQVTAAIKALDETLIHPKPWKFPVLHINPIFWDFMTTPIILQCAEKLCGDEFRLDHAFGVTSDNGVVNLHGGPNCSQRTCFSQWVGRQDVLVGQLSIGVILTPQSKETGGLCFIPGSHKAFDQRDGRTIKRELMDGHFNHYFVIVPTLEAGDVVVFSESLIHGDTGWTPKNYSRLNIYGMA